MATDNIAANSWIQQTPEVCGGDARIRNTRITVHGLVEWRRQGLTDAQIIDAIPGLGADDLDAAWKYYADHRDEIDQVIRDDRGA